MSFYEDKVSDWVIYEWFWSYVKLCAFQWPYKLIACQRDSSNMKSGKLRKLEGGQKICIFRGVALLGEDNVLGGGWYPSAHYATLILFSKEL